ncbi:40S ribosomal protein S17 [Mortierella sp. GBA43]|nr:40S ribosomal protein S17 [Mortierella sp. GBA43]
MDGYLLEDHASIRIQHTTNRLPDIDSRSWADSIDIRTRRRTALEIKDLDLTGMKYCRGQLPTSRKPPHISHCLQYLKSKDQPDHSYSLTMEQPGFGRVRTKTVKRASKVLIEKYYPRLTLDFQTNKKIASEVAIIPSKRLRNKIAGFTTHLMKRIQRGPVRGISFKLQEEERERKDNYIPEVSALDTSAIEIDTETQNLLKSLNFEDLPGVTAIEVKQAPVETRKPRAPRPERA